APSQGWSSARESKFMNSANLNAVCPLCRREIPESAGANASRLCDECRSMIETIRPRTPKTSPLAGAQEFKRDLPLEMPVEPDARGLTAQSAPPLMGQPPPAHVEPESALSSQPLREYQAAPVGSQYSHHNVIEDDALGEWPLVVHQD